MAVYHGRRGRLYMSTTGTGAAVPVAKLTSWSLDQSVDRVDVTSFGDTNKAYVQGLKDITGAFDGFYDDTEATVFTGVDSADGVKLYLYVSTDAAGRYWYGPAWVDVSINTGVGDAVKISGTFAANGQWGRILS